MATDQELFKTFFAWEVDLCVKLKQHNSVLGLRNELKDEWNRKTNKAALCNKIRDVQRLLEKTAESRHQVQKCQQGLNDSEFRSQLEMTELDIQQELNGCLETNVKDLKACDVELRNLRNEQKHKDANGVANANWRSEKFTAMTLGEITTEILERENQNRRCEESLRENGFTPLGWNRSSQDQMANEGKANDQRDKPSRSQGKEGDRIESDAQNQRGSRSSRTSGPGSGGAAAGAPDGSDSKERDHRSKSRASRNGDDESEDGTNEGEGSQARRNGRPRNARQYPDRPSNGRDGPSLLSRKRSSNDKDGNGAGKSPSKKRRQIPQKPLAPSTIAGATGMREKDKPHDKASGDDDIEDLSLDDIARERFFEVVQNDSALQSYILDASAPSQNGLPEVPVGRIEGMVKRLHHAYGQGHDGWDWKTAPPIAEYLTSSGKVRDGSVVKNLILREWHQKWHTFMEKLRADGKGYYVDRYEDAKRRLEHVDSILPPPSRPPVGPGAEMQWFLYRKKVVEEEAPRVRDAWEKYIKQCRARDGSRDLLRHALDAYDLVLAQLDRKQGPEWPPEAKRMQDRPIPARLADDPRRVVFEARKIGFDCEDIPGNWTFLETLGMGGFGHAGLWVKYDSAGWILDRKVVKETYFMPHEWKDHSHWAEHDRGKFEEPREVSIQRLLSSCYESFNIVNILGHRVYKDKAMYRVYMELCEHGDLEDLICNYKKFGTSIPKDQNGQPVNCLIPNVLMWSIFEALKNAMCLLQLGRQPTQPKPSPPVRDTWDKFPGAIFHRDIKPCNVFLAKPDDRIWKSLPMPKLGDFGLSIETKADGCNVARESHDCGTNGYKPPESVVYDVAEFDEGHPHPYTSKSEIFEMGRTMICLMNLVESRDVAQARYFQNNEFLEPSNRAKQFYDSALVQLVRECVSSEPGARPDVEQLSDAIDRNVTRTIGLRGLPMKFKESNGSEMYRFQPDKYAAWVKEA